MGRARKERPKKPVSSAVKTGAEPGHSFQVFGNMWTVTVVVVDSLRQGPFVLAISSSKTVAQQIAAEYLVKVVLPAAASVGVDVTDLLPALVSLVRSGKHGDALEKWQSERGRKKRLSSLPTFVLQEAVLDRINDETVLGRTPGR